MLLCCMKEAVWNERKGKEYWGQQNLDTDGFIHCSTEEGFQYIAPYFESEADEYVIVYLDESKLESRVVYEDGDENVSGYPHIYGLVNQSAVIRTIPFNSL